MRSFIAALAAVAVQAEWIPESSFKNLILEQKQYVNGGNFTPITININGKDTTKYIVSDWCSSEGKSYICNMNNRGFIMNSEVYESTAPDFYRPNLLGGSIEWDVNVGEFECGCLNTFYTVKMPSKDWNGNLSTAGDSWYYCDANVHESLCPEFDLQEANKYSWATTPHTCNSPNEHGHYDYCDGAGQCALNIVDQLQWNGYGPGQQYTINTEQDFHVKVSFEDADSSSGHLNSFSTTLSQNGREQTMTAYGCDYVNGMIKDISDGMAFVVSSWGEGISDPSVTNWLTKDRCSGVCNVHAQETIKNIKITEGTIKPSGPSPSDYDPSKYQFGQSCAHATDDLCGSQSCPSISHCRWSWPWGESFDGPNAHCRCDIKV